MTEFNPTVRAVLIWAAVFLTAPWAAKSIVEYLFWVLS